MKIALINPGNLENAPYIKYYTDIFDQFDDIEYAFISWNRSSDELKDYDSTNFMFDKSSPPTLHKIKKLHHYVKYAKYVTKVLEKNSFDLVIVFTLQAALYLSRYLLKNYSKRYIFDIRDFSPIYPFFRYRIKKILDHSLLTVISSIGFKDWLPKEYSYILCHNIRREFIIQAFNSDMQSVSFKGSNPISVLTIGQIRDYESNYKIISSLGDDVDFKLIFAGDGIASDALIESSKGVKNVFFSGRYEKEYENSIVKESDMINVLLSNSIGSNTLMSNRFYLSIIHKKPMIVNSNSVQARYIYQYNLGVVVDSNQNIKDEIIRYRENFNENEYNLGRMKILHQIKSDIDKFETHIRMLVRKKA